MSGERRRPVWTRALPQRPWVAAAVSLTALAFFATGAIVARGQAADESMRVLQSGISSGIAALQSCQSRPCSDEHIAALIESNELYLRQYAALEEEAAAKPLSGMADDEPPFSAGARPFDSSEDLLRRFQEAGLSMDAVEWHLRPSEHLRRIGYMLLFGLYMGGPFSVVLVLYFCLVLLKFLVRFAGALLRGVQS